VFKHHDLAREILDLLDAMETRLREILALIKRLEVRLGEKAKENQH